MSLTLIQPIEIVYQRSDDLVELCRRRLVWPWDDHGEDQLSWQQPDSGRVVEDRNVNRASRVVDVSALLHRLEPAGCEAISEEMKHEQTNQY